VAFRVQKLRYIILSLSPQTPKNPDQWLELACTILNAEMINNAISAAQVVRVQRNAPSVMRFYVLSNILSRCISITKTTENNLCLFRKQKKIWLTTRHSQGRGTRRPFCASHQTPVHLHASTCFEEGSNNPARIIRPVRVSSHQDEAC